MKVDNALQVLQHSLGLDEYGQGKPYRNHFVTGENDGDWKVCMAHVEAGRMKRHGPSELYGGNDSYCFTVTDAGKLYVQENSPPPPKLTAGQKRYRRYLDADCSMTFGEWMKCPAAFR